MTGWAAGITVPAPADSLVISIGTTESRRSRSRNQSKSDPFEEQIQVCNAQIVEDTAIVLGVLHLASPDRTNRFGMDRDLNRPAASIQVGLRAPSGIASSQAMTVATPASPCFAR